MRHGYRLRLMRGKSISGQLCVIVRVGRFGVRAFMARVIRFMHYAVASLRLARLTLGLFQGCPG